MTHPSGERRYDLDWLRIGAFGILIFYHVGMYYVPWHFHVNSPRPIDWLQPFMVLVNPWRLMLLFIVSGAATRFMMDKWSLGAFTKARTARLLVPILFGMLVIVPPQTWAEIAQINGGSALPFWDFYPLYVTASGGWISNGPPITPTWNHLWFVVYLLVYTLMIASAVALDRGLPARLSRFVDRLASGWGLFLVPVAWLTLVQLVLKPRFPETHALIDDWTTHGQAAMAFCFGFAAARAPGLWEALVRRRRIWLGLALGSTLVYVGAMSLWIAGLIPDSIGRGMMRWSFGADQWCSSMALLGYAARYLAGCDHPARRYLTEAIFPYYIVHQTAIILIAWGLWDAHLPTGIEAALLIAGTAITCALTFEIVKRVPVLRPLFGLRHVGASAGSVPALKSEPAG